MSEPTFDASLPFGLIGTGALAHAIAATWAARGLEHGEAQPVQVWARRASAGVQLKDAVQRAVGELDGQDALTLVQGIDECAGLATIILAVRDSDLEMVATELAEFPAERPDCVVLHASGALPPAVLEPLTLAGYHIGRMHPLVSLRRKADPRAFRGIGFSIAGAGQAQERAEALAHWLGGWSLPPLPDREASVRYHAAASLLAGGLGVLFEHSLDGMARALSDRDSARRGLIQLLRSVATNLEEVEPRDALTGPSARGDVQVVKQHLETLSPQGAELYRALLPAMLEMAHARGSLNDADKGRMLEYLAQFGVL